MLKEYADHSHSVETLILSAVGLVLNVDNLISVSIEEREMIRHILIQELASATETRTYEAQPIEINDGSKDVSEVPSKFMLLRQLDHLTTEESLYQAVQPFEGVYRSMLIRDKLTKMSCEFAFVEFKDVKVGIHIYIK